MEFGQSSIMQCKTAVDTGLTRSVGLVWRKEEREEGEPYLGCCGAEEGARAAVVGEME